ncbi:MAG: PA14 domain-containing protein [Phycisphaeraceae bacterium]
MDLRFTGDLALWQALLLAVTLAGAAFWLYRRELVTQRGLAGWGLPALRAGAVFLLVMMLAGPVLHLRQVIGQLSRVLIFVDASQSMGVHDEQMDAGRKLLAMQRMGWLPSAALDTQLLDAADSLARAHQIAASALRDPEQDAPGGDLKEAARNFANELELALDKIKELKPGRIAVNPPISGHAVMDIWKDIPGDKVSDLTGNPKFRQAPDQQIVLDRLASLENIGDNYGARVRGYLTAPAGGNYTFWIASDDASQWLLSTDESPANLQPIARADGYTAKNQWESRPGQKSDPVALLTGKRYYFEAYLKEGGGDDFVQVGWQLPDGMMERPIPASRLSYVAALPGTTPHQAMQEMVQRFEKELLEPAKQIVQLKDDAGQSKTRQALASLAAAVGTYEEALSSAFTAYAEELTASGDSSVKSALQRFDAMSRWQRVQAVLLDGDQPMLGRLMDKHDLEVLALDGKVARRLWSSQDSHHLPASLPAAPDAASTDLAEPLKAQLSGGQTQNVRTTAVLFSDGQHNRGASPLEAATVLGGRHIAAYTVGMGSLTPPRDLAIVKVQAPASVFQKDRVKGVITLKDNIPPGQPITLRIECEGKTLWQQALVTTGEHLRLIEYDFAIEEAVKDELLRQQQGVIVSGLPLAMKASVTPVEGERQTDNNSADMLIRAVVNKRKVLILDGRPRWEFRYLRNTLERDQQWVANTLVGMADADNRRWPRGDDAGTFPKDIATLYSYELVIVGEVPRDFLTDQELEWLRDFVGKRGGAVVFIDGQRGHLRRFADSPISVLLPVQFKPPADAMRLPDQLRLTGAGQSLAPLTLTTPSDANAALWENLKAPHWCASVTALPGGETLVEAVGHGQITPAVVTRQYGAGRVWYQAFDESWRWRYEVADLHHDRYWHQVANWVIEKPYAARDTHVALNVEGLTFQPGDSAEVTIRVQDGLGRPMFDAQAQALLTRDGRPFGTVDFAPDPNQGGAYRAHTGALPPGQYQVAVRVAGLPAEQMKARTLFIVVPSESEELTNLTVNRDLLRNIADRSGGEYFPEEDVARLADRLESMSQAKVIESDLSLWDNWHWFIPIILLLTAEWLIRKRTGMI